MKISKILLVDDDHNIRLIAQIGLEDTPEWTVVTASSGQECLEKARDERPDLILLDVMMPGMDGKTTFDKLKAASETAAIPVIFMTAKVQSHEMEGYLSMGATGVITKPFDPITLSSEIKKLVGTHAA